MFHLQLQINEKHVNLSRVYLAFAILTLILHKTNSEPLGEFVTHASSDNTIKKDCQFLVDCQQGDNSPDEKKEHTLRLGVATYADRFSRREEGAAAYESDKCDPWVNMSVNWNRWTQGVLH